MISKAKPARHLKAFICGIVGAAVIVVVMYAHAGGVLLSGLLIAGGISALTRQIVQMTVSIAVTEKKRSSYAVILSVHQ